MTIGEVIKRTDKYLKKEYVGPLVIDVQNKEDMDALVTQYQLPMNTFIAASDSDFCKEDEFPEIATIINRLQREKANFFVRGISSFYFLRGEESLLKVLTQLLSLSIDGHVVLLTWQCKDYLSKMMLKDPRLENRICIIEGPSAVRPKLVFTLQGINLGPSHETVSGIREIARAVEAEIADTIYVKTAKSKQTYPSSLYIITEMKDSFEVLCQKDNATLILERDYGTEEDWTYVLSEFDRHPSWENLINTQIGNTKSLDVVISDYANHKSEKRWLWIYTIGLKMFGAGENWYLESASQKANSPAEFIRNVYRLILEFSPHSAEFAEAYPQRKAILNSLGNPREEVTDFCKIVLSKQRDAIFYLTDNTVQEKELIFRLLDKYGADYDKKELKDILQTVYPDLYSYLEPYRFQNDLLNSYFQDYKYQKVLNKITPEFLSVVEQQAIDRDYNQILNPRSAVIEKIDRTDAQVYFTDAMGVEFLGFIMAECENLSMLAKVTVCRCELPSITSRNKEFWESYSSEQHPIRTISEIDEVKHHGKYDYDYSKTKLPIYLMKELEIIDNLLNKIQADLIQGTAYSKAILISDHGASRLAVIHETENLLEMAESGTHSGRCCLKSDVDEKPRNAVDADDFWALANYDRFKGSRKANVEVHGGATLEEVTVPIIEITYKHGGLEIKLLPLDAPDSFAGIPEIKVGYKKPAALKIYASQKLTDVSIEIEGHHYPAAMTEDYYYVVSEMKEIRRARQYQVDVFSCGNKIASSLPIKVRNEGMGEKSIL